MPVSWASRSAVLDVTLRFALITSFKRGNAARALQRLQLIAGRYRQFPEVTDPVELGQLPRQHGPERAWARLPGLAIEDLIEEVLGSEVGK